MTNKNIHNRTDTLINSANARIKIKLNMFNGVLSGNLIEKPIAPISQQTCAEGTLDFGCEQNSGYVGII